MIAERKLPDVLLIEETKQNSDFKTESFLINNYKSPIRLDRSEFGEGLMQYSMNGIICNTLPHFEVPPLELLCSELVVAKKKWIFMVFTDPKCQHRNNFLRSVHVFQSCTGSVRERYRNGRYQYRYSKQNKFRFWQINFFLRCVWTIQFSDVENLLHTCYFNESTKVLPETSILEIGLVD